MWCVSDTLVTYFWIKRDICGVTVGDLCNISVISLLFCTNVTKSYQKYTKKVPLNFYGKIGHLGPLKCGRWREPYSPKGSTEDLNGRKERAAKCDLYVNLTHEIIDFGSCFLYNLYVNLTG